MSDAKPLPQRRSLRLPAYHYTESAAYFITACTTDHRCLFGKIVDGEMQLNAYGEIAAREWLRTAEMRPMATLDEWVVMPNHMHGIVVIEAADEVRAGERGGGRQEGFAGDRRSPLRSERAGVPVARGSAKASLGAMIAGYKAAVTRGIRELQTASSEHVWQRNYYEHVIRNDEDLQSIREYIVSNPARWSDDRYYIEPSNGS